MSETVDVAVVGAGHLGSIHARVLSSVDCARLTHVVDVDMGKAGDLAVRHGATPLEDVADLPDDVFAAVVATPTVTHRAVGCALMERGVHVMVEKPIASDPEEGAALVAVAEATGCTLMVGHSERFNPVILALEEHAFAPRFIDSQRVSPFSFRSADIGVVLDMMIHDIDIILHLVKSPVKAVHAVGVPVIGRSEDIANARILFENGAVANATASRVALKTERKIRMFANDAYVALDFHAKTGRIVRKGPGLEGDFDPEQIGDVSNPLEIMRKKLVRQEELPIRDVEPLRAEDEAFLRAARTGEAPPVTGRHGLLAVETAMQIVASLEESLGRA